jgi:hypothetical protein
MIAYSPSPVYSQGGSLLDHEKYRSEDATQYTVWCAADDTVPTNVVLDLGGPNVVTGIGEHRSICCGKLSMGSAVSIAAGFEIIFRHACIFAQFFGLSRGFAGAAKA